MTDVAPQRSPLSPPMQPISEPSRPVAIVEWVGSSELGPLKPFYETAPNPKATRRMLLVFFYFAPSAEVVHLFA